MYTPLGPALLHRLVEAAAAALGAEHHRAVALHQLGVHHRAVLTLVHRQLGEAEGLRELPDRRLRVRVQQRRVDARAPAARASHADHSFVTLVINYRHAGISTAAQSGTDH